MISQLVEPPSLEIAQDSKIAPVPLRVRPAVLQDQSRNLDFLRASAVSFVLSAHLLAFHNRLAGFSHHLGLYGVLLFFIHTSLVLLDSLRRQAEKTRDKGLFAGFVTRRVFRIYPASIAVVATVWLFRLPVAFVHPGFFSASRMTISELVTNSFWSRTSRGQNRFSERSEVFPTR
jgi:peptidoglycan/LPS O-acetylase OafA/YrhL